MAAAAAAASPRPNHPPAHAHARHHLAFSRPFARPGRPTHSLASGTYPRSGEAALPARPTSPMGHLPHRGILHEGRSMSVITEAYAVPSRLLGIYRFLLRIKSQGESLDVIEKTLSLESLVR